MKMYFSAKMDKNANAVCDSNGILLLRSFSE